MRLKQRVSFVRWSVLRMAVGARNLTTTGQIGDGREAAAADYVVEHARHGDFEYKTLIPDLVLESTYLG